MAILIHRIKEKKRSVDGGTTVIFEMTPEKVIRKDQKLDGGPVSIQMAPIDLKVKDILIADTDTRVQRDLRTYLEALRYPQIRLVNNPRDLLITIQKSKDIFCFCDYRMLQMPGLELLSVPIVALTPPDYGKNIHAIYQKRIAGEPTGPIGVLRKPIQLKALREILFKFIGPPLKKIAQ